MSRPKKYLNRFNKLEQKLLLVFFLVILTSSLVWSRRAVSDDGSPPAFGGEYREGIVGSPLHINPLLAPANDVDLDLSQIVYDGLYEFDQNLNLQPNLAESLPEIGDGGKEYSIKLKDNLFWHDGQPLTADDVVYTFEAVQNPDFASPLRFSWNRVGVEKIDDRTVRLTIRESSATFIANLTLGILPRHIWGNLPVQNFALSTYNLEPVGSGPFQINKLDQNRDGEIEELELKAYPDYHKGRPYLDKLKFKFYKTTDELISAYQSRDVDGLGYVPYDQNLFIKPRKNLKQQTLSLPQYQAAFINQTHNPAALGDKNVRLALSKSVDKQKIISEVYGGEAEEAYGPILPGHLGYHEQIPGAEMNIYDPAAAENLLEESGWSLDSETGFRTDEQSRIITVELTTNSFSPNVRVAELLKEMWQSVGIQVILKVEELAALEDEYIRPRNYQLLLFSENVGADPDPFPFWHSSQVRDPGLNLTNFANSTADRLLAEARVNQATESRAEKYRRFQEIFVGEVPAIFISRSVFVYNIPTKLRGVSLNTVVTSADRFANIEQWYVKTR